MLEHQTSSDRKDPKQITAYHAHVYYDPATSRREAALLRERVGELFPGVRLGRWHDQPVGPHPQAMYQIVFRPDQLDRKSTRLNSSHANISYAVFCLKKKKYPHHRYSV